ncbi:hypothetical protein ACSBR1_039958 [Camellia fascicularis]
MPIQKGTILAKSFNGGAIFRGIAVAISNSLSINSELSRRNGRLIKKARATVQMRKSLGINFERMEDDVIGKIVQIEDKYLERIDDGGRATEA